MYKVIKGFTDLQTGDRYNVGDEFPKQGITVSEKRIALLASSANRQKAPLIAKVEKAEKRLDPASPVQPIKRVEREAPPKKEKPEQEVKTETTKRRKKSESR